MNKKRLFALILAGIAVILDIIVPLSPDSTQIFLWILDILLIILSVYLWEIKRRVGNRLKILRVREERLC